MPTAQKQHPQPATCKIMSSGMDGLRHLPRAAQQSFGMRSICRVVTCLTDDLPRDNPMSRYAWLVCAESKQMLWLGKIVSDSSEAVYFHIGDAGAVRNSENTDFTKMIMRFLAKHIGKEIVVVPEESLESIIDDTFVEIGDETGISSADYIRGFLG